MCKERLCTNKLGLECESNIFRERRFIWFQKDMSMGCIGPRTGLMVFHIVEWRCDSSLRGRLFSQRMVSSNMVWKIASSHFNRPWYKQSGKYRQVKYISLRLKPLVRNQARDDLWLLESTDLTYGNDNVCVCVAVVLGWSSTHLATN